MAALAGILNHSLTAGQALTSKSATPMASSAAASGSASSASSSSSSSSTISANDFLTLLVTEMQNQDPTADTDPNEYINQLVNVNSLEQLIDINQTLTTDLGSTATSAGGTTPAGQVAASTSSLTGKTASGASPQVQAGQLAAAPSAVSSSGAASASQALAARPKHAPGNLSVPDATPAALRVAQSLSGRTHAQSIASRLPGAQ